MDKIVVDKDIEKFIGFLDSHKKFMGLSDWEIIVANEFKELGDVFAEVEPNIYEQTLKVTLSKDFSVLEPKRQMNILFHELVHARVNIHEKRVENLTEDEEEYMVNDITRGFERFGKFKFPKTIVKK